MTQDVDQLLTIVEIARHFNLPESTCRYYCKRFAAFIDCVGEGRRRRYRRSTIDVIAAILDEMKKSRTATAVEEALSIRFPPKDVAIHKKEEIITAHPVTNEQNDQHAPLTSPFPPQAISLLERQTIALEGIAAILSAFVGKFLPDTSRSQTTDSSVEELKKEVARLAILLDSSEKMQQADIDQLRTWLQHIAKKRA